MQIYKHTCTTTGKSYIGQTGNLEQRTLNHRNPNSRCIAFRNAIRKYGWNCFQTEILADNLTIDESNDLEVRLIAEHKTLAPAGYNLAVGGRNKVITEATRTKLRRKKTASHIQKIALANTGKTRTAEQRLRMSIAAQGRLLTEETKLKIAKSNRGQVKPIVTCPHCALSGNVGPMHRWHFNNCGSRS